MSDVKPSRPSLTGIRYGAAYYAEYQLSDRLEEDLDLMVAAGLTVIRVGESVWSTWEPRDGELDTDWLLPVLDGAHARGIEVILGTPTYAIPPWLQVKHPEIAAEQGTGRPMPWGSRQEIDYAHPTFRVYAERIIRAVVGRYAEHPAVIGFQVDNEPGAIFFNAHVFSEFVDRLRAQYGDVDTLNREWGLTYWSHRIAQWSELWTPDGNSLPQYDLAWRRFQADLTTEYIAWQAGLVREYSRPDQFVTTCIAYPRPAVHDADLVRSLDVTAGNPYYGMQDHLAAGTDLTPITPWSTTGVWGLFRQADRTWSSKQERFLITETNASTISGSAHNYPGYPGQLQLAAFALVSRGAAMVEYWHWHSLHYGTETYWGGILPHSQRPGRVYREVSQIGAALRAIGSGLDGYVPDADVAILYSNDSRWALEFMPPFHTADMEPDRTAYAQIFDAFYRGIIDAGAQARIVHPDQLGTDAAAFAARHPVLVAPALYAATDETLSFLTDYAAAGGHLVVGIRTGYADEEARARLAVAPALLAEPAGVWYEEFSNLERPVRVTGSGGFTPSSDAAATRWLDLLHVEHADVLARYDHPELGAYPAVTTCTTGAGRITYVGTQPNPTLGADLLRWAVPEPVAARWTRSATVTVASGTNAAGARTWFLSNWSSGPATATVPAPVRDLVGGERLAAGQEIALGPWAARVLAEV